MNFMLETRHWVTMIIAVILAVSAVIFLPLVVAIYPVATYAFLIVALAVIFDILANATEGRRAPLKVAAWICLLLAALVALMPLKGDFSDMQMTIQAWTNAGWSLPRGIWEGVKRLNRYSALHQQALLISLALGVAVGALAIIIPLGSILNPRIGRNRKSNTGPWQAGWMSPRDIASLASNKTGLPLALHNGKLLRYQKNDAKGWRGGHHLVVSGTRGGKGVSAVIPAIIDHQGPVVVLDIKGENFAVTRRYRQSLGRKVAVLNPFGIIEDSNDQFNPLDYIRLNELGRDVALVADGLVRPEPGDGAHFSEMARQLVTAAIEVVVTQEEPNRRNLIAVADLLLSGNLDTTLEAWVKNKDLVGHRPAQTAATILRAGDRERGSIQTAVSKAFEWMQSDNMRHFLARSSFDMDDLLDDEVDLFIVVPLDQVDKQAVFMRLFINLVLGTVVRQDGRRKVKAPILLALDEFVRMGRMEQIMNIANVAAGAGVEALFVTQDTGQVEKAYGPNDARSIFGSCITKRVFNLNDIETAEWVARHFGDNTVYSQQIREAKTINEKRDVSYSEQRQKIMTAEQIMGMKTDELLLLVGNRNPLKAKQNIYFKRKNYHGKFDGNPLVL
ncbi:type IV secretory system conjugative DNA transfer family protein (plasmid) [Pseudochrobactrum algeriensis]|uniref:type IV secretory system conjugative DNA transfer family protein n=1 Tax=Pseudochrobactrum algeriensis TaxID=2834768 RepID=UPI001BCEBD05|nr:type IV secretory system conjugative DNA transfer family protein [Pseudochrobactrum algeriensis]QVQ38614.1 type IV secretory system conjugative DNA transfer family protein [Pseudochrobactrum algeriensis]QVQ38741.1 type IV secretory system conjugative DNA transfer family protein [Pseudochrobactrum algeriensis]QVQ42284.1 type IV secretory system conjugative DNA transfer family protein [Pseudochrobactrum algeriensis]